MKNDNDKYLNPETNPFIVKEEPMTAEDKIELDNLDGRAPFVPVNAATAEIVVGILSTKFIGRNEIEIGGRKFVRMAAGNWTIDEYDLQDLSDNERRGILDLLWSD